MDEQLVLTAQTLKLNPDLRRADVTGDVFVVKNVPARKYLTVSVNQWNLLRNFGNPATVPDVLRAVIMNRTCLPLREYYELVLKAHRAGVLHAAKQAEPEVRASRWVLPLNPWVAIVLTLVCGVAAGLLLYQQRVPHLGLWPREVLFNLAIGWGILIAAVSLGQVLAASVLHSGRGEVYQPRFHWLRPVPYFGVRLDDACMTSVPTQVGIECARLLPVLGSAAALWHYRPEWGLPHLVAVLVMLRPVAGACVPRMLSTLCRGAVLDTQKNFLFGLNRRWKAALKVGLARISPLYVAARILWGAAWIVLCVFVVLRLLNQSVHDVLGSATYWREVGLVFSGLLAAALLAYVLVPVARATWVSTRERFRRIGRFFRRWKVNTAEPASPEQVSRLMAESLLFRRISPAERTALMQAGQIKVFPGLKTFQRFADKNTEVGLILSGKVRLFRRTQAGRAERALTLLEGDVFGAHALLDPDRQQVQLRALTPVVALLLPMAEFEARVLRPLGTPVVHDLLHKVPFLRGVSFCASWHPQAMARFAQLASVVSYGEGDVIVAERQDSHQFYVVYEGQVAVKRRTRTKARLKPGAFFGEVSILQNSSAVSDVVAREPSRCLTISRADFLRFVTHNPLVSLQLEEISSRRLGRPIFPLSGSSFDVR